MYSSLLPLSILEDIECLAISLQYLISENYKFNQYFIATAGNKTFNSGLKSYLVGDKIEIRCTSTLGMFILDDVISSSIQNSKLLRLG